MPQVATQAATGIDLADHRHIESNDAGVAHELGGQAAATVQTANGAESNATCTGPACSCRLMQHPTQQLSTHLVDHHPIEGNDAGVAQGIEGVSLLVHLCTALHAVGGVQLLDSHFHSQPAGQPHAAKLATTKLLDLCQVIGIDLLQGGRHLQALDLVNRTLFAADQRAPGQLVGTAAYCKCACQAGALVLQLPPLVSLRGQHR